MARWYASHGRHDLPWRLTDDPWDILLSEVMLQQTQVSRVRSRWEEFRRRWPAPAELAAAPLAEVLRAWQGLGYPRRAVALQRTAAIVAATGWPAGEAGLRSLPGVGEYTARALGVLAFVSQSGRVPRDVNVTRVAARAALGVAPAEGRSAALDAAVASGRPSSMTRRMYTYALFDVGALHCRARPRCPGCPFFRSCAWRQQLPAAPARPEENRGPAYRGSVRELRGALLRALLDGVASTDTAGLRARVAGCAAVGSPFALEAALEGLRRDALIPIAGQSSALRPT